MIDIKIAPSLLSANMGELAAEVERLEKAGADMIHLDVMDGHFVPNLTFGAPIIQQLRSCTSLPFDVHLMVKSPDNFIEEMAQAGADIITIHPEADFHPYRTLQHIRALGCQAGVALNPGTSMEVLKPLLDVIDLVLVMTVNPGFGGQTFLDDQLKKIKAIRQLIDKEAKSIRLSVDGGIQDQTSKQVIAAGADILVAGTFVFKDGPHHYQDHIQMLRKAI